MPGFKPKFFTGLVVIISAVLVVYWPFHQKEIRKGAPEETLRTIGSPEKISPVKQAVLPAVEKPVAGIEPPQQERFSNSVKNGSVDVIRLLAPETSFVVRCELTF